MTVHEIIETNCQLEPENTPHRNHSRFGWVHSILMGEWQGLMRIYLLGFAPVER